MRRSETRAVLLAALLLGPAAAGAVESEVDLDYSAEHDGWKTSCVAEFDGRKTDVCFIEKRDEESGLGLGIVAFPYFDEITGELWLSVPKAAEWEELPSPLRVELDGEVTGYDVTLHPNKGLPDEQSESASAVGYLLMIGPRQVSEMLLEVEELRVALPKMADDAEPLAASFDMSGAREAWQALMAHHGWE